MYDGAALLEVHDLHAGYGPRDVLFGVDLSVHRGEIVTILGHNGAGKSTTLKAIMGLVSTRSGAIRIDGTDITHWKPPERIELGIAYSPQEHFIFPDLTTEQNLAMGQYVTRHDPHAEARRDEVLSLFPILGERMNMRAREHERWAATHARSGHGHVFAPTAARAGRAVARHLTARVRGHPGGPSVLER